MTVRVITDSMADLPLDIIKKYNITVIPVNVIFGTETFRDGVDLTTDQFYARLVSTKINPSTAVPSIQVFVATYEKVAKEADEILMLAISHKLSATYDTACKAAEMVKTKARIEVIDTMHVIMAEGMIAMLAAKAAKEGVHLDEIIKQVHNNMARAEEHMVFDTLEYLKRNGRIGAAQAFLGSILKINPVLRLKAGEVYPISRERSRAKAIDSLYNFALEYKNIEAIAIEDATTPDEADKLAERVRLKFPNNVIYRSKVGAVLGAHVGPSIIAMSIIGDRKTN